MESSQDNTLTIGQLAKRVGLRTSALRYYEEQGLLLPDGRSEAGYRFFKPEAEQILRFIQRAQHLGFSLFSVLASRLPGLGQLGQAVLAYGRQFLRVNQGGVSTRRDEVYDLSLLPGRGRYLELWPRRGRFICTNRDSVGLNL